MDNYLSFRRFTSVDPNIARFGSTVEEFQLQRGAPDPNPVLSPMANQAVTDVRLALTRTGSDRLRLDQPLEPSVNPYEGPKATLVLSRNAVKKLNGKVVGDLTRLVQGGAVADGNLQGLMLDSMRRVNGMREFVAHLNGLAEYVQVRTLAASKG
jgi:hypothetical protein